MDKKQPHQQYADNAIGKLEILSSKIDIAIGALQFLIGWNDDDTVMLAYIRDLLQDTKLNHQAILANIERLSELANPNAPEELPF